jgi:hypothetical protein
MTDLFTTAKVAPVRHEAISRFVVTDEAPNGSILRFDCGDGISLSMSIYPTDNDSWMFLTAVGWKLDTDGNISFNDVPFTGPADMKYNLVWETRPNALGFDRDRIILISPSDGAAATDKAPRGKMITASTVQYAVSDYGAICLEFITDTERRTGRSVSDSQRGRVPQTIKMLRLVANGPGWEHAIAAGFWWEKNRIEFPRAELVIEPNRHYDCKACITYGETADPLYPTIYRIDLDKDVTVSEKKNTKTNDKSTAPADKKTAPANGWTAAEMSRFWGSANGLMAAAGFERAVINDEVHKALSDAAGKKIEHLEEFTGDPNAAIKAVKTYVDKVKADGDDTEPDDDEEPDDHVMGDLDPEDDEPRPDEILGQKVRDLITAAFPDASDTTRLFAYFKEFTGHQHIPGALAALGMDGTIKKIAEGIAAKKATKKANNGAETNGDDKPQQRASDAPATPPANTSATVPANDSPLPESPFSANFKLLDAHGVDVQFTIRAGRVSDGVKRVNQAIEFLLDNGYTVPATHQSAPASNGTSRSKSESDRPTSSNRGESDCALIKVGTSFQGGKPQLQFEVDGFEHTVNFTKDTKEKLVSILKDVTNPKTKRPFTVADLADGAKFGGSFIVAWSKNEKDGKTYNNVESVRNA